MKKKQDSAPPMPSSMPMGQGGRPAAPALPDTTTLFAHATASHQAGNLQQAAMLYRMVLAAQPRHAEALTNLGAIYLKNGELGMAGQLIETSLSLNPDQAHAYINLGIILQLLNRFDEALTAYERAIALDPNLMDAHNNRGKVLMALKRFDAALASYDRVIAIHPSRAEAHTNRGIALQGMERFDEALASYERAIALKPDFAVAHNNRGTVLNELNRLDDALASYDRAIALKPDFSDAHNNRGNVLGELKQFDAALASYERAISCKPDHADACNNLGRALLELARFDDALASFDRAISLKADFVDAHNNRGSALKELQRFDDALASYDRAIHLKHDYAEAYWNKSLLKLLLGDFEEGWRLYEWRWKRKYSREIHRSFQTAPWLGKESIKGKTILLHTEQGLGDTLQMLRYAPMLAAQGARVVVDVMPPLASIAATVDGVSLVTTPKEALPDFDMRCPFMSLPLALKTTVQTIPGTTPYLFASEKNQSVWRNELGQKKRKRVGLVWSGSTDHAKDQNRSVALQTLLPLLDLDADFYSLQKDYREADRAVMQSDRRIRDCSGMLHDFGDTAGLIAQLDLVISVDTSVAHLAGALGKPVWILLPFAPDFRWLLERIDSPWYPTARLFRQAKLHDWDSVIRQVRIELDVLVAAAPGLRLSPPW